MTHVFQSIKSALVFTLIITVTNTTIPNKSAKEGVLL